MNASLVIQRIDQQIGGAHRNPAQGNGPRRLGIEFRQARREHRPQSANLRRILGEVYGAHAGEHVQRMRDA